MTAEANNTLFLTLLILDELYKAIFLNIFRGAQAVLACGGVFLGQSSNSVFWTEMFVQPVLMASKSTHMVFGSVCVHYVVFLPYSPVQSTSCLDFGVQFVNLLPEPIVQFRPLGL